jgi:hypothetical protein
MLKKIELEDVICRSQKSPAKGIAAIGQFAATYMRAGSSLEACTDQNYGGFL